MLNINFFINKMQCLYKDLGKIPTVEEFDESYGSVSWLRKSGYTWNQVLELSGLPNTYRKPDGLVEDIEKQLHKLYGKDNVANLIKQDLNSPATFKIKDIAIAVRYSCVKSDGYYKFKNRTQCDYLILVGSEGEMYFMSKPNAKVISIHPGRSGKYSKYEINGLDDIKCELHRYQSTNLL